MFHDQLKGIKKLIAQELFTCMLGPHQIQRLKPLRNLSNVLNVSMLLYDYWCNHLIRFLFCLLRSHHSEH